MSTRGSKLVFLSNPYGIYTFVQSIVVSPRLLRQEGHWMCILAIPLRLHGTSGPRCVLLRHGCRCHDGVVIEQQNRRYQDDSVILSAANSLAAGMRYTKLKQQQHPCSGRRRRSLPSRGGCRLLYGSFSCKSELESGAGPVLTCLVQSATGALKHCRHIVFRDCWHIGVEGVSIVHSTEVTDGPRPCSNLPRVHRQNPSRLVSCGHFRTG